MPGHSLLLLLLPSHISSSSSSLKRAVPTMKLKTPIHSFIFSHICRLARALSKAKSITVQIIKDMQLVHHFMEPLLLKKSKKKTKLFLGSFRMHYNWCSSQVLPMPSPSPVLYYDSTTWDSNSEESPELSGYLNWLELEKKGCDKYSTNDIDHQQDDVDRLADAFIASCHEKFRLEKQESYRRFQEMMARSV
ncbi:uncharacterized protein LOC124922232 [Impatiens glandulifera]|uniref:uncharacterized protein LOC124922232 n=1 Tax=Impatiens glandulifera TaxID=253017 RepID=UPI001FB185CF|nr:uncharacterized protein LOC124922232 [Impatiens glandulifera]